MKITPDHIDQSGIVSDVLRQAQNALAHHQDTGRRASVTCKITIKTNKESGKTEVAAKITSALPVGDEDQTTVRLPSVVIAKFGGDHPGQQTIGTGEQ